MFRTKSKTIFVDIAGESAFAACTSDAKSPMVVEGLQEIPLTTETALIDGLRQLGGIRGNGMVSVACGIYPKERVVAIATVDPKRFSEGAYLNDLVQEAAKIDAAKYSLYMLSPQDGADIARAGGGSRQALICGAPTDVLALQQDELLLQGCFPSRFELGTIATLGGMTNYLAHTQSKMPTLLLEIGLETTGVFIVTAEGVESSRSVQFGINTMIHQVQKDLGLKDEDSARRLFFSNSFDFAGLGQQLTKRLVRELQASIGFFEVQTGLSVSQLCGTLIPSKVQWLDKTLADVLGMRLLALDYPAWLEAHGITLSPAAMMAARGAGWLGVFSLMISHRRAEDEAAA